MPFLRKTKPAVKVSPATALEIARALERIAGPLPVVGGILQAISGAVGVILENSQVS